MVALDRLPVPSEIVHQLDRRAVGQARAKRELATAVYRHYLDQTQRAADPGMRAGRHHALLLGPTGSGKTYLVRTLADILGVPVAICAATSLSEVGYMGESVDSLFASLVLAAGGDLAKAQRGIIFLDEVDKLRRATDVGRDVSGEGVQNALLTLLDGIPVRWKRGETTVEMDSSRVLFVFAGAFAGLPAMMRERARSRRGATLGFGGVAGSPQGALDDAEAYRIAGTDDLVRFGLIPELVGRFATISVVEPLEVPDLVRILGDVEGSPLSLERHHFERHGLRLELTDGAGEALAQRAHEGGTGARGLTRLLAKVLSPIAWQLPELVEKGVAGVRVQREAVEGTAQLQLLSEAEAGGRACPAIGVDVLRRAAYGGALPPPPAAESPVHFSAEDAQRAIEELKPRVQFQHLRSSRLLSWKQFEQGRRPAEVAWVLSRLVALSTPLARFVDALLVLPEENLESLVHYAAYLHLREPPPGSRPTPRRPRHRGQPELDI